MAYLQRHTAAVKSLNNIFRQPFNSVFLSQQISQQYFQQCFSLTTNQPTILYVMNSQTNKAE